MAERSLAQKLLIKPGHKVLVMNAPDGYSPGPVPEGVDVKSSGAFDVVQCFVSSKADIDRLAPKAIKGLKPGGMLWFSFPKKTGKIKSDISRDIGWGILHQAGMEGIATISIDDTWSGIRFRPTHEIKARKGG